MTQNSHKTLVDLHENYYKLWATPEMRARHGYVLSPATFLLSGAMYSQLQEIALLVSDFQKNLHMLYQEVQDDRDSHPMKGMIRNMIKTATGGFDSFPHNREVPVCKVDIMVGENDQLSIAEIDTYNPRGIPFALFLRDLYQRAGLIPENEFLLDGVVPAITQFLDGEEEWYWLSAHKERYYQPVFRIMKKVLEQDYGITTELIDLEASGLDVCQKNKISLIPLACNQGREHQQARYLQQRYAQNQERFWYPFTPWTSNKGWFGLLSNPLEQEILQPFQNIFARQDLYQRYIPETLLLTKRFKKDAIVDVFRERHQNVLLKQNISSGMKGVLFPEDASFEQKLQQVSHMKNPQWTLQSLVSQKKFAMPYFTSQGQLDTGDYYVRICAYVGPGGELLDAEVTARPEPDVHGAPDCLMMPCTIKK